MQFHHHGYVSGDPRLEPASGIGLTRSPELPAEIDVLIVGSGPAGIIATAQLAQFPGVVTRTIERRDGRLQQGQADGIQARSLETFQAFGFAEQVRQEAFQITEMAFWKPNPDALSEVSRAAVTIDDEHGMSEFPHVAVNQARVIDYFADFARRSPARGDIDYGYELVDLEVLDQGDYPIRVVLRHESPDLPGKLRTVHAKYVVGADGAPSSVRHAMGAKLVGDRSLHAWGVADVLAITDFPDVRKKCAIQSRDGGNILLIPREGNYLFRMYVDLGEVGPEDRGAIRQTPLEEILDRARAIMHPYTLEVRDVPWHSVYEVAHRLADRFDDAATSPDGTPRVFLTGDACHTHSAKAGQGMNVSIQDGWNIGWKLGYVVSGRSPEVLLESYAAERRVIAQDLITFDREWSTMMAKKPHEFASPSELEDFYVATAEFPFGFMTQYRDPLLTGPNRHQALAAGFPLGKRFKSALTTRVADGVSLHLGHHHRADGRFRIYAFADAQGDNLTAWARWMRDSPESPVQRSRVAGTDLDAVLDIKVIYPQEHHAVDLGAVPDLFLPRSGPYGLIDYEKVYAAQPGADIFAERGIDRGGVAVLVRPDQYVSHIVPLNRPEELATFLRTVLTDRAAQPASVGAAV
ncbi:Salicylate hydroxylase [Leucobacter sp. 7(1)]|uniref:FAD-dependent monooxygenase n=1 Tax=Leucobacter sp. 7(1) TaxID=1255613 RepID=UPI00097F1D3A|nr:FAD-dependent monooxygenase [Leucobacter sp. 7(1)]SJN08118.1 Salicylate hydroxylase [Leucobacter sp. 7(1)]